jgi:hypothetical protein
VRSRRLKLYDFVADVVEAGQAVLGAELQLDPARAKAVMLLIARGICEKNAKSLVYIPEAINLALAERNARVWAAYQVDSPAARKFTPERAAELAAEHDLSMQMVYRILAEQRAAEMSDVQPELPGLDGAP